MQQAECSLYGAIYNCCSWAIWWAGKEVAARGLSDDVESETQSSEGRDLNRIAPKESFVWKCRARYYKRTDRLGATHRYWNARHVNSVWILAQVPETDQSALDDSDA